MKIFLNERSLESHANWGDALKFFWDAAIELRGYAELKRDSSFFEGTEFKQRFGLLTAAFSPEIRAQLRQIAFSDRYFVCWRPTRRSSPDEIYLCETRQDLVWDESICEAAEVLLNNCSCFVGVLSSVTSAFGGRTVLALKRGEQEVPCTVPNASNLLSVRDWLIQNSARFDPASRQAPRDFQTVLCRDPLRFRPTNHFWNVAGKDRRVYEEIQTGWYYYVDEGHPGPSAHLEVFDANRDHLGIADIDTGQLDSSAVVSGRRIYW